MNVQVARARAAAARGFGQAAPVVTKRVVVEVPVPSVEQEREVHRLLEVNARLVSECDGLRAELARMQAMQSLMAVAS